MNQDFALLGSGSTANSYIIQSNSSLYVVDNGFSLKEFEKRLFSLSLDPSNIELIFITHTHSDHTKGMASLVKKYNIPVVCHEKVNLDRLMNVQYRRLDIKEGKDYPYKDIKFQAFRTSHDASYSLGYYFSLENFSLCIITDTGKVTPEMYDFARRSHYLFLESNYSDLMLKEGRYPEFLKKRILSNRGHLSNDDAGKFMEELHRYDSVLTEQIYLCHLSKNNNRPEKVIEEVNQWYTGTIPWKVCHHGEMVCSPRSYLQLSS